MGFNSGFKGLNISLHAQLISIIFACVIYYLHSCNKTIPRQRYTLPLIHVQRYRNLIYGCMWWRLSDCRAIGVHFQILPHPTTHYHATAV